MFGSGAQTGMMGITTQVRLHVIQPGPVQGTCGFCTGLRGTTVRATSAAPFAAPTIRQVRSTFTAFGAFLRIDFYPEAPARL